LDYIGDLTLSNGVPMLKISSLKKSKKFYSIIFLGLVIIAGVSAYLYVNRPAEIKTGEITGVSRDGIIAKSKQSLEIQYDKLQAPSHETITYESQPIRLSGENAAILAWDQQGEEGVTTEVRTHNGNNWTPWVESLHVDGGKDGVKIEKSSTLVLANSIKELQFRYILAGTDSASATVDVDSATIQTIDSRQGPDPTAKSNSFFDGIGSFFHLNDTAEAKINGPRIYSRAEWGSPEPNSSSWPPEYAVLGQAVVHHTVTTEDPQSSATVRAIWHYHAITLGWGDIGYNYLVDSHGNIFQGRYYDKSYAEEHNVEVIAGHVYGHNSGTTGIAAIGNFDQRDVTEAQRVSISNVIGYKLAPANVNPSGTGGFGTAVVGHRDLLSTACPGKYLYARLPGIRTLASQYYANYNAQYKLDFAQHSQTIRRNGVAVSPSTPLKPHDDVEVSIRLRNNGAETWQNTGSYKTVLGTNKNRNRTSIFYEPSSWIARNRPGTFSKKIDPGTGQEVNATTVPPGQVAVFTFKLRIPDLLSGGELSSKLYKEYFQPVQDGRLWFPNDIGLYQAITVEKHSYKWQQMSQGIYTNATMSTPAPSTLATNTRYYVRLSLKNTGNATWNQRTFRLATAHPSNRSSEIYDTSWLARNRPGALKQATVAPGATGTIEFWIKTAPEPTARREYFVPVVENITWLQDIGLHWIIRSN
jgi:hypothetical protein